MGTIIGEGITFDMNLFYKAVEEKYPELTH